ncbi:hypothetical protein COT72_03225 [archaeon CG10_big_fil_rev_8_21_14_0_10_43_11]|nr:MAG: hypothetical protein COT72_03225 [archaeon CG10_big_fil_rev_8_21_14_0_10_43_11]
MTPDYPVAEFITFFPGKSIDSLEQEMGRQDPRVLTLNTFLGLQDLLKRELNETALAVLLKDEWYVLPNTQYNPEFNSLHVCPESSVLNLPAQKHASFRMYGGLRAFEEYGDNELKMSDKDIINTLMLGAVMQNFETQELGVLYMFGNKPCFKYLSGDVNGELTLGEYLLNTGITPLGKQLSKQ